jgi:hypothetical protein
VKAADVFRFNVLSKVWISLRKSKYWW